MGFRFFTCSFNCINETLCLLQLRLAVIKFNIVLWRIIRHDDFDPESNLLSFVDLRRLDNEKDYGFIG